MKLLPRRRASSETSDQATPSHPKHSRRRRTRKRLAFSIGTTATAWLMVSAGLLGHWVSSNHSEGDLDTGYLDKTIDGDQFSFGFPCERRDFPGHAISFIRFWEGEPGALTESGKPPKDVPPHVKLEDGDLAQDPPIVIDVGGVYTVTITGWIYKPGEEGNPDEIVGLTFEVDPEGYSFYMDVKIGGPGGGTIFRHPDPHGALDGTGTWPPVGLFPFTDDDGGIIEGVPGAFLCEPGELMASTTITFEGTIPIALYLQLGGTAPAFCDQEPDSNLFSVIVNEGLDGSGAELFNGPLCDLFDDPPLPLAGQLDPGDSFELKFTITIDPSLVEPWAELLTEGVEIPLVFICNQWNRALGDGWHEQSEQLLDLSIIQFGGTPVAATVEYVYIDDLSILNGSVWEDLDGDGVKDDGTPEPVTPEGRSADTSNTEDTEAAAPEPAADPPLSGVKVTLYDGTGAVLATTETDADGNYRFGDLPNGSYHVEFEAPPGHDFAPPAEEGELPASDVVEEEIVAVEGASTTIGSTPVVTLGPGINEGMADAAVTAPEGADLEADPEAEVGTSSDDLDEPPASLSGVVWEDLNEDGIRLEWSDADNDGVNDIDALLLEDQDSDSDGVTDLEALRLLAVDADEDGVMDPDPDFVPEPLLEGVPVQLLDAVGNVVAETTTDADGFYEFTDVVPGDYRVVVVAPVDYQFTLFDHSATFLDSVEPDDIGMARALARAVGEAVAAAYDLLDSDFDPQLATEQSRTWTGSLNITLAPGANEVGVADAGLIYVPPPVEPPPEEPAPELPPGWEESPPPPDEPPPAEEPTPPPPPEEVPPGWGTP